MLRRDEQISDCAMPGEKVLSDAEKAYRRGFAQGAHEMHYAYEAGIQHYHAERWLLRVLTWRGKGRLWKTGRKVKSERPPVWESMVKAKPNGAPHR
jgi:hypothetical protein